MNSNRRIIIPALLIVLAAAFCASCEKRSDCDCYDPAYAEKHKNDICTTDCPGVIGCDGKAYCNECEMRRNGIMTKK